MAEYRNVCQICGKAFTATSPRTKYCSALCRAKGAKQARSSWEEKTDYRTSQRLLMRRRRNEDRNVINAREREEALQELQDAREAAADLFKKKLPELRKMAKAGDLSAQRQLAAEKGDVLEYWRLYKEMILQTEKQYDMRPDRLHTVGGIDVHEDNFEYMALEEYDRACTDHEGA